MGSKRLALAASSAWSLVFAPTVHSAPGDLDTTFGANGLVWIDVSGEMDHARGVAVQNDGKLLIGRDNERDLSVVRLNSDGSLDSGFGANGVASLGGGGRVLATAAVLAQSDGNLVAVGTVDNDFAVARFLSDGRADTSFGSGGLARASVAAAPLASAVVQQGDGKLVIGGGVTTAAALVRFDTAGVLDASFGTGGVALYGASGSERITALTQQPDGKLVAAVASVPSAIAVFRFARDGALDPTFDGDGLAVVASPVRYGVATAVAVQGDGKIVVAGYGCSDEQCRFPEHAVVARLGADGSPDTSFGSGGRMSIEAGFSDLIVNGSLAIEPSGSILVGGEAWSGDPWWFGWYPPFDGLLARITPSGALDPGFGHAGITIIDGGDGEQGSWVAMQGIARLPDGSLVAAMTNQPEGGDARIAVVRAAAAGDQPGRLGLWVETSYGPEGGLAWFGVRRTGGSAGAVSVDYSTLSGLAQSGADFTATAGTLTWADGSAGVQDIYIPIVQDSLAEPEEKFTLRLSNPSGGASLAATVGTVTIAGAPVVNPAPLPAPAPGPVSGSGGGAGGAVEALLLALALLASRLRARVRRGP